MPKISQSKISPLATTSLANVTVVGGGSSAHSLIPLLSASGHKVNLLTRRPKDWSRHVSVQMQTMNEELGETFVGQLNKISSNPRDVIPESDVIVLCMPVHQYRDALNNLAPSINRKKAQVFVGTIYGQAGFNWMVHEMERNHKLTNVAAFAIGLIPWICRTQKYGSLGVNYGCKEINIVAVSPSNKFELLNKFFLNDVCNKWFKKGAFVQACSFLSLTLSVDNQIIHPSRCYGLWKRYGGIWKAKDDIPYFYKDFDDVSADTLRKLDDDYSKIRNAVRSHFPHRHFHYMLDYLSLERATHKSANVDIRASFQDSKQLGLIKTPTKELPNGKHVLDISSRFFTDDIPYGLLIAKWVAQELNVDTPFLDKIINWAQTLRGWTLLGDDGKICLEKCINGNCYTGIPPVYGISDVDGILD